MGAKAGTETGTGMGERKGAKQELEENGNRIGSGQRKTGTGNEKRE